MQNSEEYQQLCSCLQNLTLEERPDKRIWRLGGNTKYAVKSGYTMVNDGGTRSSVHTNIWKTPIQSQIPIFCWEQKNSYKRQSSQERMDRR